MKTSILKAFIPTGTTLHGPTGEQLQLCGDDPIQDVYGCSRNLHLKIGGQDYAASITHVGAGDRIDLVRGGGMRNLTWTFDKAGTLLTVAVPARPEFLRTLRGRKLSVVFRMKTLSGISGRTSGGKPMTLATAVKITGLSLAKPGETGDCELSIID